MSFLLNLGKLCAKQNIAPLAITALLADTMRPLTIICINDFFDSFMFYFTDCVPNCFRQFWNGLCVAGTLFTILFKYFQRKKPSGAESHPRFLSRSENHESMILLQSLVDFPFHKIYNSVAF